MKNINKDNEITIPYIKQLGKNKTKENLDILHKTLDLDIFICYSSQIIEKIK